MLEHKEERTAYLKTQALLLELKKEQAHKMKKDDQIQKQEKYAEKVTKIEKKREKSQKTREESIKQRMDYEQEKLNRAKMTHQDILRQQQEYRDRLEELSTSKLAKSMSAPKGLKSMLRTVVTEEDPLVLAENKKLRDLNFEENLRREQKKLQFKKQIILEKEMKYTERVKVMKLEREMLEKCKSEVLNKAMQNKEYKQQAILKLKGLSVLDKTEKIKTKQLAQKLIKDVDLEDIFKEEPKEKSKKDPYDQ